MMEECQETSEISINVQDVMDHLIFADVVNVNEKGNITCCSNLTFDMKESGKSFINDMSL